MTGATNNVVAAITLELIKKKSGQKWDMSHLAGLPLLGGDPLDPEASPKNPPPLEFNPPPSVPPQSNSVQGVKIPPIAGPSGGGEGVDSLKTTRKCPHIAK